MSGYALKGAPIAESIKKRYGPCKQCNGRKLIVVDSLRRGSVRYRKATHRHGTHVGPEGCLTIVFSGRVVRDWGFWTTFKKWMPWKQHHEEFGEGMSCEDARS